MIVGIDLGTTFSLASYVNHLGRVSLIPDLNVVDRFQTPSVLHLGPKGCLVGQLVEDLLEEEPGLSICRFPKLSIGTEKPVLLDHQNKPYDATAASALILRKLKQDIEAAAAGPIEACVITVPAHFNEMQRAATINAGRLADLPVIGLVEEPVAAATYFGMKAAGHNERTIFVFDLGGGTLDATILHATPDGLYVLATEGANNVGGKNFDEVIMEGIREQYRAEFGEDCRHDPEAMERLRRFATKSKIALSAPGCGVIRDSLFIAGKSMRVLLTRDQFESGAELWLEACELVCQKVLEGAGMTWNDIDDLILTGGSSLLPCIERTMRELSGLSQDRVHREQPHAAVAYGAALVAEQFHGARKTAAPPLRQMVTSNEVGIRVFDPETRRRLFVPLIPKNEPIPVREARTFYTQNDQQTHVSVEILQRKDEDSDLESLGEFRFGPLPAPAAGLAVDVEIGYDENSRIEVKATEQAQGKSVKRELSSSEEQNLNEIYLTLRQLLIQA